MTLKKAWKKVLEAFVSWKFHLLVLSTYLFIKGTLSESGWLLMAASTTGLRELINLLTLKMGVQPKEGSTDEQQK
jgi:ABC-type transport system involved in cytochrome bd biosynthesis fused ATPase/permease subunit